MTFSCGNFDFDNNECMKLLGECIPGRPGCVLAGKVKFSEAIQKRLKELEEASRKKRGKQG